MIASVSAKPSHWIEVISSRISGWRVTASITLPKMNPTPMPGPIVPRPAPTPSAIALPALRAMPSWAVWEAWARKWGRNEMSTLCSLVSVMLGDGAAEVDGSQGGEDERLQRGDQDHLEDEEGDGDRQRDHAQGGQPEQDHQAAGHEQDQQVAGEDVGEQPHRQRDDAHEVRDQDRKSVV